MFSDAHRVVTKTYLAIHLSRIVFLPENIQQLFVRDFCRIVFQLHSFRVPCGTTAHFAVRWIHCLAASVTDCRLYHPQPPYAPQCQRLEPHHLFPLQRFAINVQKSSYSEFEFLEVCFSCVKKK